MKRALAALLLAAACGTGTDGKPVAPPTSPAPVPEPPPEPPGIPIVRLVETGPDFLVWEWDPVEGATGYQVVVSRDDTPVRERPPPVFTDETTFRADGLEGGVLMRIYVRAIRETAGGRAEGLWSNYVTAATWAEPRVCTDERDHALAFGARGTWGPPVLIEEWDGEPFRFYFDVGIPANERADAEHFFGVVERLSDRIEDQLGYSILEVAGWIDEQDRGFEDLTPGLPDCSGARPGGIVVTVIPDEGERAAAIPRCAAFYWAHNDIDASWDGTMAHELFHLFGFAHSPDSTHPQQSPPGQGVPMSVRLTNRPAGPRDLGVTFEDVDALGCVFPHPDFPR